MSLSQPGRPQPVVEFPFTPKDPALTEYLQRTLGKLVSLACVPLFVEHTLTSVGVAGSAVFLPSGTHAVNWADAGVDEMRLVCFGQASDLVTKLEYMDSVNLTTYCSITSLPAVAGSSVGPWMKVTPADADTVYGLRLTLTAANTCSLNRVELQARSSHFQG